MVHANLWNEIFAFRIPSEDFRTKDPEVQNGAFVSKIRESVDCGTFIMSSDINLLVVWPLQCFLSKDYGNF